MDISRLHVTKKINASGELYATMAFLTWGLVPIYWKSLSSIGFQEVLSHRILWAAIAMFIYVTYLKELGEFLQLFRSKKIFFTLLLTTLLIMFNWNLYIWAVSTGHIVEGSLGYFLNPILNVVIGVFYLKEKLKPSHWFAVIMACIALFILFSQDVGEPLISVGLALSFALYALLRKQVPVKAHLGQLFETLMLVPIVICHFSYLAHRGELQFLRAGVTDKILLMNAGIVTVLPLIWFSKAVLELPLSIIGLFQYIAPTLQLLVGVFLFHEAFGKIHAISFGLIWFGLIVFSIDHFIKNMKARKIYKEHL